MSNEISTKGNELEIDENCFFNKLDCILKIDGISYSFEDTKFLSSNIETKKRILEVVENVIKKRYLTRYLYMHEKIEYSTILNFAKSIKHCINIDTKRGKTMIFKCLIRKKDDGRVMMRSTALGEKNAVNIELTEINIIMLDEEVKKSLIKFCEYVLLQLDPVIRGQCSMNRSDIEKILKTAKES